MIRQRVSAESAESFIVVDTIPIYSLKIAAEWYLLSHYGNSRE